jgi:hypothetical protein
MTDAIYTAHAHAVGGRSGTAKSDDGHLDVKLAFPKSMGGDGAGPIPSSCSRPAIAPASWVRWAWWPAIRASSWASTASTPRST